MEDVGGAAMGAIFGEILKTLLKKKNKAIKFNSTLANFQSIIETLDPWIKQIAQLNNDLGRPKKEIESLISEMEKGSKLISDCSQIHKMNFLAKIRYQKKIKAHLGSLCMLFSFVMVAHVVRDQKEALLATKSTRNESSFLSAEEVTGSDGSWIYDSQEMKLNNETAIETNSVEEAIN
ncbi:hypothetical protein VNO77_07276 [Canavalia gladiata]|uniref:RPW8 domain-containing protein n=1 Tax=Canavalia gladiata TaxID=3824 RepID=A0AAN9QVR2_CANGL